MADPSRTTVDRVLGALCVLGAIASGALLVWDAPLARGAPLHQGDALAKLTATGGSVRCRPEGTLFWDNAETGASLYANDAIFVPPGVEATVSFHNGSRLTVGESSLVVIDRSSRGASANLLAGSAQGEGSEGGMELRSGGAQVALAHGDGVALQAKQGEVRVEAFSGSPLLTSGDGTQSALSLDESANVTDGGTQRHRYALQLTAPSPDARLYFADRPAAIALQLRGTVPSPGWIQVSADRSFGSLVFEQQIASDAESSATFTPPGEGTYYWRAVDASGTTLSSTRRLRLLKDVPPRNIVPAEGESLSGSGGRLLSFVWSPVDGAPSYRVEVSGTSSFETVLAQAEVHGTGWRLSPPFDEGTYYWRVRTRDPMRGDSPFSKPSRFLYTRRALPNAPVLQDPTVEVEHAPP